MRSGEPIPVRASGDGEAVEARTQAPEGRVKGDGLVALEAEASDWVLLDELQGRRGVSLTVAVKLEGRRFVACAAWVGTSQTSGEPVSCYLMTDEAERTARLLTFAAAARAHLQKKP